MKKILLVCNYANVPKYSSLGFRHYFLAKEWVKLGYDVTVLSSSFNHFTYKTPICNERFNLEMIDKVKFIWVKNINYKNPHGFLRILNWLNFAISCFRFNSKNYDYIICSSPSVFNIIPYLLKNYFYKKSKLIFEVRDIWPLTLTSIGRYSIYNPFIYFLKYLEKISYEKSDLIIGTMGNLKQHIKNITNNKFKFGFVPQGYDINYLKNSEKYNIRSLCKFPKRSKFVIGYAGSMSISNNLDTIISSAKEIEKITPHINFYFLGDGIEKKRLLNMSKELNNVYFFDKVQKKYVISFLNQCDVLYDSVKKTDIYDYGISRNKMIDYMYSSKPILFSYSGYEDIITKVKNGFIIEPDNVVHLTKKIIQISKIDKKVLKSIGARGKEFITKKRQFKHLAFNYLKLVEKI